ncbi:hypothetical protein EXM22_03260 [Oceanispirochaeta crateris]|uniref:Uncharacterized protein n=1 Tax=Oceanispirochaeta crateris TaxID=2518645 RepID=A0A5C1QIR5_9SPIO|nr:hypothetical protein [Oceanispirochaeta crateris]QEN07049.1 hypothetical protein EXM22_03260 [Oceanispirochaeta crateris]
MKKMSTFLLMIAGLILSGCNSGSDEAVVGTDYLLAGYYMMAGEETALADEGSSRASAPTWWDKYDGYTYDQVIALGSDGIKVNNYPEQGQKTYITVTDADPDLTENKVYKVSSRTEYPNKSDLIDYYLEVYYLQDIWLSGLWKDGSVVEEDGDAWVTNPLARETMEVVFQDGSVRKEWIAYDTNDPYAGYYAQFPLDGDMVIPSDPDWVPTSPSASGEVSFSSKVYYYQKIISPIGWFLNENKEIFGVRYYTEKDEGNDKYTKSSLAYEHTLSRSVPTWADDDWYSDFLDWIFSGGEDETLSETVIRYAIGKNGKKTVKSSTNVVPSFGQAFTIDNEMNYTF